MSDLKQEAKAIAKKMHKDLKQGMIKSIGIDTVRLELHDRRRQLSERDYGYLETEVLRAIINQTMFA